MSIKKEGLLNKKGMGTFYRPWNSRRFNFNEEFDLCYYDDNNILKGTLKLKGAQVKAIEPSEAEGKDNCFEISNLAPENSKKSNLVVQAKSKSDMAEWINAIKNAIMEQQPKKLSVDYTEKNVVPSGSIS